MLAKECNLGVGDFIWVGGDVHVQLCDFDAVYDLMKRKPRPLPRLKILRDVKSLPEYEVEDFALEEYSPEQDQMPDQEDFPVPNVV